MPTKRECAHCQRLIDEKPLVLEPREDKRMALHRSCAALILDTIFDKLMATERGRDFLTECLQDTPKLDGYAPTS